MPVEQPTHAQQPQDRTAESVEPLTSYEQLLALRIDAEHKETARRFGVPLWMLRSPGPEVDTPDDDIDWL
ncbi:MAG: hypothetical protein E6J34_24390 [Chloroflexi bacterium]|nr:MAG: hypothetical protein E6J34_24390 [Chloroflexota bacterium]